MISTIYFRGIKMRYNLLLLLLLVIFSGCSDSDAESNPDPTPTPFQLEINNISQHQIDEVILHRDEENYKGDNVISLLTEPMLNETQILFDPCQYADKMGRRYYLTVVRMNAETDQRKIAITTERSFTFGGDSGKLHIDIYGTDFLYNYRKNEIQREECFPAE